MALFAATEEAFVLQNYAVDKVKLRAIVDSFTIL